MNYIEAINKINNYIRINVSEKRYKHCLSVALMSKHIAELFGINSLKAYLAGLSHDVAREFSIDEQKKLIDNIDSYSKEFIANEVLYHGPAGATFILNAFLIDDIEIFDAIASHSFGHKNITNLGKVIYVADYISMDRIHITENLRGEILKMDLDRMVLKVTDETIDYLNSVNKAVLPETINMYNKIMGLISEKEKGI